MKQALKKPLIQKQNILYLNKLDEQVCLYDDWIKRVEEKENTTLHQPQGSYQRHSYEPDHVIVVEGAPIKVVTYSECGYYFDLKKLEDEILIFATNKDDLSKDAINLIAQSFSLYPECEFIYGDEDEVNSNKMVRMNPWFKPDWSPDMLLSFFYFGNVFAIRTKVFRDISWLKSEDYMANLYDFCLKATMGKNSVQIKHLCRVLFHSHNLAALCISGDYEWVRQEAKNNLEKKCKCEEPPFVSIIIPSKDQPDVLKNCISSIYEKTQDVNFEIIVVDNGSNTENKDKIEQLKKTYSFQYLYAPQPFNFSKMCNQGAQNASGNYLLFLNDDIEIRQKKWLFLLLQKAALSHVGAVGAKLCYPKSKMIQHAGITNLRLGPVHKLQFKEDKRSYYYHRNQIAMNVLAVTGACLMVYKGIFEKLSGFDESFGVAFNDVDFCFRIYEAGYQNVVRNDIHLWHYESLSRGNDENLEKQKRLSKERNLLYHKHPDLYAKDPYYHPYLSRDILDTNYSFAYQYESGRCAEQIKPIRMKTELKSSWENECLILSMEYAGDLNQWIDAISKEGDGIYLQGYAFVAGSDNSCYKRFILLRNKENGILYKIPCNDVFRPDLEMNLDGSENALLCGFSIMFDRDCVEKGEYQLGVLVKEKCSRQKLYRFSPKCLTI